MSPRAAWRLEAAGFGPVYDYVAGKADWLAADLPFDGTARLAGMFTRRDVGPGGGRTPVAGAVRLLGGQGVGAGLGLHPGPVGRGCRLPGPPGGRLRRSRGGKRNAVRRVHGAPQRGRRRAGAPDEPCRGDPGRGDPFRRHTDRAVLRRRRELMTSVARTSARAWN